MYLLSNMLGIFIPFYFGSVAIEKSNKISERAYESNWIGENRKFCKALQIFIGGTVRPVRFYAGGLIPVNLNSFLQVNTFFFSLPEILRK